MLDPLVWRACAGFSAKIPTVGSRVYYFPQGHTEQSSSNPDFSSVTRTKPYRLCRLASIDYLTDHETDEVFVKFHLDPTISPQTSPETSSLNVNDDGGETESFVKILTASDANNGCGFSVPKYGADTVFPALDMESESPVQILKIRDLVGKEWQFRHIYRGTPRRHLLTHGWSKFIDAKKLVAGDSVVFIKHTGKIFVGIRRRCCGGGDTVVNFGGNLAGEGFVRDGRGRVAAEAVVEAVRAAEAMDREFEVEFYPRKGSAEFVVAEETIEVAAKVKWASGMRVKIEKVTEDFCRIQRLKGTVEKIVTAHEGAWALSPWRMLKIKWDDPELMQNEEYVSPWQVELNLPIVETSAKKKCRVKKKYVDDSSSTLTGSLSLSSSVSQNHVDEFGNTMRRSLSPSAFNFIALPAGMQGARQELNCALSSNNPNNNDDDNNNNQPLNSNNMDGSKLNDVSPDLSAASHDESSSPPSQEIPHQHDTDHSSNATQNPIKRARIISIKLFGEVIQVKQFHETETTLPTN